jgi:hypothetical protein
MKSSHLFPFVLAGSLLSLGCGSKSGDSSTAQSPADVGGGDDSTTSTANPEGTNPGECSDRADNDGAGDFDCNDSDCSGSPDCSEANTPGGCSDGADNDQDGLFDCDDPDCVGDEACGDGIEGNDAGECGDGIDNDGDGLTDCEDDDCAGFEGCDDYEGDEPGECTDGEDNDSDGLTDCNDEGCVGSPDCEGDPVGTETNPGSSCKDILDRGGSGGDGVYWIDPDGSGAFRVYCDMSTDSGGWTLIAQGGYANCASSSMMESSTVTDTDTCTFLPSSIVQRIALNSTEVYLHANTDSAEFGAWTTSAKSTGSLAINALQTPNENWHNGATFDNWDWTYSCDPYDGWPSDATVGWPNMYLSCGNNVGVHWNAEAGLGTRQHDHSSMSSIVSATYVR